MRFLHKLCSRLAALFRRSRKDDELALEIQHHIDTEIEALVANGTPPGQARNAVLREFGNVESLKEECRDSWGMHFTDTLFRHLRLAARQMLKRKGFTAIIILTLALGIGANTAIYSLANAVLFRPLPFTDPEQLVAINERNDEMDDMPVSYQNFLDWRKQQTRFSSIGVARNIGFTLISPEGSELIPGSYASHGYFETLKATPVIGRLFSADDDRPGAIPTTILGENYWRDRFGGRVAGIVPFSVVDDDFRERSASRYRRACSQGSSS